MRSDLPATYDDKYRGRPNGEHNSELSDPKQPLVRQLLTVDAQTGIVNNDSAVGQ